MVDLSVDTIKDEYPDMVYGENYVKFDYKAGGEAVIRMITQDLRGMFPLDSKGMSLGQNTNDERISKTFKTWI